MEDQKIKRIRRKKQMSEENKETIENEAIDVKMIEEKGEATGIETIEVTELQEGNDIFLSHGYSNVKVTKNGKVTNVKLPIKSSGVTELIEEFKAREPKPPVEDVLVKKDSDQGKQMKLTENRWVKMPNLGDEKYVKELDKYESDLGVAILQKGLNVKLKNKAGEEITNPSEKIMMLKNMGFSGPQFSQVVTDIRNMTEWTEEELRDFFGQS